MGVLYCATNHVACLPFKRGGEEEEEGGLPCDSECWQTVCRETPAPSHTRIANLTPYSSLVGTSSSLYRVSAGYIDRVSMFNIFTHTRIIKSLFFHSFHMAMVLRERKNQPVTPI